MDRGLKFETDPNEITVEVAVEVWDFVVGEMIVNLRIRLL